MGIIALLFGLGDGLLFMLLAIWAFIFLFNVFHQHHVEDIPGGIEHPVKISYKSFSKKT